MKNQDHQNVRNSSLSYLALRQALGILGLALPIVLWIINGFVLKTSISHFYYSHASTVFTGFMITFGIFLIFYPGRQDKADRISDNWITTIGGIGAIITALIPTAFYSQCDSPLQFSIGLIDFCSDSPELTTQYLHNNIALGTIHLISAATFLALMGYMSFARFTKGNLTSKMKRFYKFCAFMVWIPLVLLGFEFLTDIKWTDYDVFIGECVSLGFFGISWLVKGHAFKRFGLK